jgi:Ca2+-binding RTX toxin-like protein
LYGNGGNDVLHGDELDDTWMEAMATTSCAAANGRDRFRGGAGNDAIHGEADNDDAEGGEGNDELQGGDGDDVLDGGAETTGCTAARAPTTEREATAATADRQQRQ